MLVTCPECATRYEVDDSAFSSGGRAVRCNHCGCEWYQIGPSAAQAGAARAVSTVSTEQSEASTYALALEGETAEPASASTPPDWAASNADAFRKPASVRAGRRAAGAAPERETGAPSRAVARGNRKKGALTPRADDGRGDYAARVDATSRLPAILDPETEGLRRSALNGQRARSSSKVGVIIGLAAVAAAAVVAVQFIGAPSSTESTGALDGDADIVAVETSAITGVSAGERVIDTVPSDSAGADGLQPGVVFVERKFDLQDLPEGPALIVFGVVANNGPEDVPAPIIEVVSRDAAGVELQRFRAVAEGDVLAVGQSARFSARMMYPTSPVVGVDFYIAN